MTRSTSRAERGQWVNDALRLPDACELATTKGTRRREVSEQQGTVHSSGSTCRELCRNSSSPSGIVLLPMNWSLYAAYCQTRKWRGKRSVRCSCSCMVPETTWLRERERKREEVTWQWFCGRQRVGGEQSLEGRGGSKVSAEKLRESSSSGEKQRGMMTPLRWLAATSLSNISEGSHDSPSSKFGRNSAISSALWMTVLARNKTELQVQQEQEGATTELLADE